MQEIDSAVAEPRSPRLYSGACRWHLSTTDQLLITEGAVNLQQQQGGQDPEAMLDPVVQL